MPISYLYVENKWRPYECNTCSNDESTRFKEGVSIIINSNLMNFYINKNMVPTQTHSKKIKLMTQLRLCTFNLFWKIPYIGKLFILENYLNGKLAWIENVLALKKTLN